MNGFLIFRAGGFLALACLLTSCNMALVVSSNKKPVKVIMGEETPPVPFPPAVATETPTLSRDGGPTLCEIYIPPEFPEFPGIEGQLGNLEELNSNNSLAVERLLAYIKLKDGIMEKFRLDRRQVYDAYLKRCLQHK